jgi:hypothetical protein
MSAWEEVVAGLRAGIRQLAEARRWLALARDGCLDAAAQIAAVLYGSTQPQAADIVAAFTMAAELYGAVIGTVGQIEQLAVGYLHLLEGEPSPPAANARSAQPPPLPISDARVEQTRASMRPGVRRAQTTAWWLQRDGSRVRLLSGPDKDPGGWEQTAERYLRARFPNAHPAVYELSRHVEIQLAVRSHHQRFEHEVLVIDRRVCGRDVDSRGYRYTCDLALPHVLADGAKLTVVEHDGTRVTYVGRRAK